MPASPDAARVARYTARLSPASTSARQKSRRFFIRHGDFIARFAGITGGGDKQITA